MRLSSDSTNRCVPATWKLTIMSAAVAVSTSLKPLRFSSAVTALRSCVAQTIQDQQISRIDALKRLLCTNAGIGSLKGLEAFVGLEILNLANNALSTIEPLHTLPSLAQLDLSANPGLKCNEIDALTARGVTTTIPEHCKLGSTK